VKQGVAEISLGGTLMSSVLWIDSLHAITAIGGAITAFTGAIIGIVGVVRILFKKRAN
jgi:hypothetical protein